MHANKKKERLRDPNDTLGNLFHMHALSKEQKNKKKEGSSDICSCGGFSSTLYLPLSPCFDVLDLVSTILSTFPHRRHHSISEETGVVQEKLILMFGRYVA